MLFGKMSLPYKVAYVLLGVTGLALVDSGYGILGHCCLLASFTLVLVTTSDNADGPQSHT